MSLKIDSLSDDCLLPIFDRVPLSDLLHLDRVCPRWAKLLPSACARRRTLPLILARRQNKHKHFTIPLNSTFEVSFDGGYISLKPYFDLQGSELFASLRLPDFTDLWPYISHRGRPEANLTEMARLYHARDSGQMVTYLTNLFPNVDTLVVIHAKCLENELNSVIGLLESSWPLKILKLWLRISWVDHTYTDRPEHHPVRTLLHNINQQSSLRQLTLDIDGDIQDKFTFPSEYYSFIAQLKVVELYLGFYDPDNAICDTVHRFDSTKLRQISFGNVKTLNMEVVLNQEFNFAYKVNQIYSFLSFKTAERLYELCWRFSNLTSLRIDWSSQITFTQLVTNLASLTQLTHLTLGITFNQHPENAFTLVDRVDGDEERPRQISLPQVKILVLIFFSRRSHREFESLSPLMFPLIEVIIMVDGKPSFMNRCTICRTITNDQDNREMNKRCHRLLILSLKDKFSNKPVRFYARHFSPAYFDWTNYVRTEDDDLSEEVEA